MSYGMIAMGIGTVAAGYMASSSASDATDAQSQSSAAAVAENRRQYEQTRQDYQPYRQAGYGALARLNGLLGLSAPNETRDAVRSRLVGRFTTAGTPGTAAALAYGGNNSESGDSNFGFTPATPGTPSVVDEAGLNSEIDRELASQQKASSDPSYGSLLRDLPQYKPFTGADLQNDPGYKFGLDQGTQAVDRSAASKGGLYSGATLKALERYGNDYGSTKFGEAFSRDQSVQNQIFQREKANRDSQFNMLSGLAGTGQTATSQIGSLGATMAQNNGQNMIGAGNAQAAGSLAQGNIWGSAVNQLGSYARGGTWGGGYSGSTGYSDGKDPLGGFIVANGWN